ncbi:MAG: zinc-binding dehydrogenase, partial [bacterium]|nr:zinc-binding dehydrogenase [bacterium]
KLDGFGNVQMVEVERPEPGSGQMLVEVKRSLISRGSELFRRYVLEEAVSPDIMGYSDAGKIVAIGPGVENFSADQRVMVNGPHAQYVLANESGPRKRAFALPDDLTNEAATFLPLTTSSVMWMRTSPIEPGQTAVILGQGIVGSLCAQIIRERNPGRVIVVDAYPLRCEIAGKLGPDVVINVSKKDSVAEVKKLTDGIGADLVVECVGGNMGIRSFEQAQQMLAPGGAIHLIAKYQGEPLPLDGDHFMNKVLVAGIRMDQSREECMEDAAQMLIDGRVQISELITHRLPWEQTPDAYHMLYNKPDEALGVVLEWDG